MRVIPAELVEVLQGQHELYMKGCAVTGMIHRQHEGQAASDQDHVLLAA
jgi:hypothetical protein